MKKHLLFLLCILLFFSSCRKEGLYSDSKDKKVDTVQFKANAKKWLQSKKEQSVDSEDFIKGFENSAQWNEISYSSLSLSEYIFFLPTNNNVSGTGLVFFVDKDDLKIQNSFVINITYSGSILSPSEIIKGLLRMKNNNFSGSITAYTLSNNFLWENGYSNGNPTYQKYHIKTEFQKQVIKTNGIGTNVIISKACKEYYLVTYWDDGSIDRELIGTFCDNGCEQTISIGKDGHQIIGLNCGNSGGSGGNSVSPDGITAYGGKLSCKSFTFYSPNSTSNWQEAGVKGLQLVGDWFGPWGGFQVKNYGNIYVGIPKNLANGTNITQGQAATAAAKAANRAAEIQMAKYFGMTSSQFGAITSGTIAAEFRELMQGFLSDDIGGGCTVSRYSNFTGTILGLADWRSTDPCN